MEAWGCVKAQTIISSWTRADILPVSAPSIPVADEIEEVERGIADLFQCLPIDELMDVQEYINIDKNAEIYSSSDENVLFQEIVDTVNHIEILAEEEEPFEERIVTSSEALLGCDNMPCLHTLHKRI